MRFFISATVVMSDSFQAVLNTSPLVFDGAFGTEIYRRNIFTNQCYDDLNLRNRNLVKEIASAYGSAGVDVLTTNTYGANRFALERYGLEDRVEAINIAGVELVRDVAQEYSDDSRRVFVAGSIGFPAEDILLKRDRAQIVAEFARQAKALITGGVDLIIFETQPSRACSEIMVDAMASLDQRVPFIMSYGLNPTYLQYPNSIESRAPIFSTFFAPFAPNKPQPVAWGLNCCLGPVDMLQVVQEVVKSVDLPLVVQPNAGSPQAFEGRQIYYSSPEYLATYAMRYVDLGAAAVGGCCGVTPSDLSEIVKMVKPTSHSRRQQIVLHSVAENVKEQEESPVESRSRLANKLVNGQWVQTVEAIPPCGYDLTKFLEKIAIVRDGGVDAVNLPDGPRASARISTIVAASKALTEAQIEPVVHMCCRDRNLIGLQADLIGCAALNISNLLFITGDPPKLGLYPDATGVFDCDAIGLCKLQRRLNRGVDLAGQSIGKPTNAFFGCGFDPSALNRQKEIERLRQKIDAGALFAVSQPVFDPNALISFLEELGERTIPVIAGIWPFVSYRNALFMRKEVPGVVVPDQIMARMEIAATKSSEEQTAMGIEIARESLASLRSYIQGVQVSAPLGRVDISLSVLAK
ncbi:MAG: bifunctional homocysteine S-methyltransferase/methylenetetrahydrofolate reductase [Planctomycetia bacterium]|nr:bifunctional homocysteine S-methyltransferase/methylenetetrahydrofolate reductase [Planctomycetia bacterium]